jgi:SRSO17 transposase
LKEFGFLSVLFGSKPRLENFLAFFFGITISSSATVSGIADWLGDWKNQSTLNRFLTEAKWKVSSFYEIYFGWMKKKVRETSKTVYFILDDSKAKKSGELIERVVKDFDPNEKKQVLCHPLVVSLLRLADVELPFQLTLYDKTKKDQPDFKSKLDIAIIHFKEFLRQIKPEEKKVVVLFDAWYCAQKFISLLPSRVGWVSRPKRNRLVKIDGFWYSLKELQRWVKSWNFRRVKIKDEYHWACYLRIEMKGLGMVTLVLAKPSRYSRSVEFFVSNLEVSAEEILQHYAERWGIEVFFRTAKQNLGLDGYQMRKYRGNRRYWALVQLSYAILSVLQSQWKRTCKTIGDTIAKLRQTLQKLTQNYGIGFGVLIEICVERKFAKV